MDTDKEGLLRGFYGEKRGLKILDQFKKLCSFVVLSSVISVPSVAKCFGNRERLQKTQPFTGTRGEGTTSQVGRGGRLKRGRRSEHRYQPPQYERIWVLARQQAQHGVDQRAVE